jgi:hypothetical protein
VEIQKEAETNVACTHLQDVCELSRWIEVAMHSIAANDLEGLRESIAQQEVLAKTVWADHCRNSSKDLTLDADILIAMGKLYQSSLQYGTLLRHSNKTLNMLMTLNRSFRGDVSGGAAVTPKRQTWSCEV